MPTTGRFKRRGDMPEFYRIWWSINKPLPSKIKVFSEDPDDSRPQDIDPELLNKQVLDPNKEYVCEIIFDFHSKSKNPESVITEPVIGTTVHDVLKTIEKGFQSYLVPTSRETPMEEHYFTKTHERQYMSKDEFVYRQISHYIDGKTRLNLIRKYEAGKLKVYELMGDTVFFDGVRKHGTKIKLSIGS